MADSASSTAATDTSLMNSASDKVPFFKKRSTKKNLRKRKADSSPTRLQSDDDDDDDEELTSQVVTKNRKHTATPFVQSTRRGKKRREHGINDDDEEDQDDFAEKIGVQYAADRSARMQKSDATRYSTEWELENEELAKRKQAGPQAKKAANSKMQVGPQRAPANIRVTARFDYQPDVCKDYKETGFCGYGDSCIFLHDRGDYKTGWQLEKEWEEAMRNKTRFGSTDPNKYAVSDDDDSDEELPFACLICREEFKNPVVTKCNHYFCEQCAINNHKKSPKCYACGASTGGVFDTAKKMLEKLKQKKERIAENSSDVEEQPEDDGNDFTIEGLEERPVSSDEDSS
ncbi:zinc finger protein 183 [Lichtheimia corymbifera JMRC:FSU:9682]|uniref:Pre-mRNA-splicing factor CWC24 n=1 Tax=Lichtheimia corymbifera JMRC:FSU:9682 TaxID=1263082 RepID=A0A068RPZ6_9FUNG|nr:zinc finger protein 183 [Lichtheimia corymbifera JMRC:FSU:9682]